MGLSRPPSRPRLGFCCLSEGSARCCGVAFESSDGILLAPEETSRCDVPQPGTSDPVLSLHVWLRGGRGPQDWEPWEHGGLHPTEHRELEPRQRGTGVGSLPVPLSQPVAGVPSPLLLVNFTSQVCLGQSIRMQLLASYNQKKRRPNRFVKCTCGTKLGRTNGVLFVLRRSCNQFPFTVPPKPPKARRGEQLGLRGKSRIWIPTGKGPGHPGGLGYSTH